MNRLVCIAVITLLSACGGSGSDGGGNRAFEVVGHGLEIVGNGVETVGTGLETVGNCLESASANLVGVVGDGCGLLPNPLNRPPRIEGEPPQATEAAAYYFAPQFTDPDGDSLSISVSDLPAWLQFDPASGAVSGTPGSGDRGLSGEFTYTADDGQASSERRYQVFVADDALEAALRSGDARQVQDPARFINAALQYIGDTVASARQIKAALFNLSESGEPRGDGNSLTAIDWHPTHDAALLSASYGDNVEVMTSNSTFRGDGRLAERTLAIAGEAAGAQRNARILALGGNPMRNAYRNAAHLNDQMHQFLDNAIVWLSGRGDFEQRPLNTVIAHAAQNYYFPDELAIRHWLDQHYPEQVRYNSADSCDATALAGCLGEGVDLLIISQDGSGGEAAAAAVQQWLDAGKPVLYLHLDGGFLEVGRALFPVLGIGYEGDNYWARLELQAYDPSRNINQPPAAIASIATLLERLRDNSFSVDLSQCQDKSCPDSSGYTEQFGAAASAVQTMLDQLDAAKLRLFEAAGRRFHKLLLLLADHYRQHLQFPMDKTASDTLTFLQSLYADVAVYNNRELNPVAADLGDFSRVDFSHITPASRERSYTSKRHFQPAGLYALPGQTFTVTRLDQAEVDTTVFINSLRDGSAHIFNDHGYQRPRFLQSLRYPIAPGETLRLTSPYGGPLQIGYSANGAEVRFRFDGVGEHPFWASAADDEGFASAMAAGDYDWAELATPGFVVHSTHDQMSESIDNWRTPTALAAATERYMHNFAHVLAGFQGPGIDVVAEIHDFAAINGFAVDNIDIVKHMNADKASCGYGCSGNPYDAYWAFSPTGHGDLHELGHGLERGRFRFAGWNYHASTNPYSYYSKYQYFLDTGEGPSCQSLPFAELKDTLLTSRQQADPVAYMQAAELNSWSQGVAITLQMMMAAQAEGVLSSGWHLLSRLHILDREFNRADDSDESWLARRDSLGFGQYSRDQARALDNNDWMLIALSKASGRDMRAFLLMWGLSFSNTAAAQVAALGYPAMPLAFYDSGARNYCKGLDKPAIAID